MKVFTGKVIGKKQQKTVTVLVERFVTHPLYGKRLKRTRKYQVHDEADTQMGAKVSFAACRPISKQKRWMIITPKVVEEKKMAKGKGKK